tara:strand:- start:1027 stop:2034 length:1008 start_codon:yes stop_codon:yes gene_type:complete
MKTLFHSKLVNHPFGDPGIVVEFIFDNRALLFDLGNIGSLTGGVLLKTSDVFVSHTHIDHFIGFDHLLRVCFGRGKTIRMYGPENFIHNVEGKLAGFTWNLVDRYDESLTLEVREISCEKIKKATFRAIDKFNRSDEGEEPFIDNVLLDESAFTVKAAILEHRVPCLGFALHEKPHIKINKDRLDAYGFEQGPWLNLLKGMIHQSQPLETSIAVPIKTNGQFETKEFPLRELKEQLVLISPGQKIGYVTDTVFNSANAKRIINLVENADRFYCESPFLAEEEERGLDRCHLTTKQAGTLARMAKVKSLTVFHFSSKHVKRKAQLIQEALSAFRSG